MSAGLEIFLITIIVFAGLNAIWAIFFRQSIGHALLSVIVLLGITMALAFAVMRRRQKRLRSERRLPEIHA